MYKISYCSNVHAGATLDETRQNLCRYAVEVKRCFSPDAKMGVGLWLANQAASELIADSAKRDEFKAFLDESGLETFTFNGFPFGNFHQRIVKHAVYHPTWFDADRLDYTLRLVDLIQRFSSPGREGSPSDLGPVSISTLPIAWGDPHPGGTALGIAASQLRKLAGELAEIRKRSGRNVYVCLEPEPGCVLQTSGDIVNFFENHLCAGDYTGVSEQAIRHHIRVCHDVCHSVVMCEPQAVALAAYQRAGILLGKAQISSAIAVDFDALDSTGRAEAFAELSGFAEDRYLHQTTVQLGEGQPVFYEDLPLALQQVERADLACGVWRIHFHVPVYLEQFGHLRASQQEILDFVQVCRDYSDVEHFEVETYAWNVLPQGLQQADLSVGIAAELTWFQKVAQRYLCQDPAEAVQRDS